MDDFKYPCILSGKYFEVISDDGKNVQARCKYCPVGSKFYKGSLNATTNFLDHLKRKHKDELPGYEKDLQEFTKRRKIAKQSCPPPSQPSIADKFPVNPKKTVTKTEKLVLNFLVKGMHPLSTVQEDGFIELIKGLDPTAKVMSRYTTTRRLKEQFADEKTRITNLVGKIPNICITADAWTCDGKKRAFFGLTAHWISDDLTRQSIALACRRFKGSHTYDTIAEMIIRILKEFEIKVEKVVKAITDSGSNFLKAFREFSTQQQIENDSDNEEDIETADFVDIGALLDDTDNQSICVLPAHLPCTSHKLNLICSTDIMNKKTPALQRSAFAKAQGIWNRISRSTQVAENIRDLCGSALVTPVCTRWNSMYDSLCCLMKQREKLKEICTTAKVEHFKESEAEFIQQYLNCVKPIAQGLDRLQGEHNTFFGELLPTLLTIEKQLVKLESTSPSHCPYLPKLLLESFRRRFSTMLNISHEVDDAVIASISHPYFKLRWIPKEKISTLKQLFVDKVLCENAKTEVGSNASSSASPSTTPIQVGTQKEVKDDAFFEFEEFDAPPDNAENWKQRIIAKCDDYLKSDNDAIEMLHTFPEIKPVFVKYNTALPSSAPVERLFNYAKMVLSPNRRRLTDENFEILTLLKVNSKF